jgi:hypothetical protein
MKSSLDDPEAFIEDCTGTDAEQARAARNTMVCLARIEGGAAIGHTRKSQGRVLDRCSACGSVDTSRRPE